MSTTLRLYVITAALLAGLLLGFVGGWQVQSWRLGLQATAEAVERGKATVRALDRAAELTAQLQTKVDHANANATRRAQALRTDADRARAELDSLRNDIAARGASDPGAPASATDPDRADTERELLSQCAKALAEMAAKADRHASDARALFDAWPEPAACSLMK
jgi:hypothetical protein